MKNDNNKDNLGRDERFISLRNAINKLFDEPFLPIIRKEDLGRAGDWWDRIWHPRVNVAETETEYLVTAEVPGIKTEDINVEYKNGSLYLSGESKMEEEEENNNKKFYSYERRHGSFARQIRLGDDNVDEENIDAMVKDGILKVILPKKHQELPRKKINIRTS